MSKIKQTIVYGLVAAGLALGSCSPMYTTGGKERVFSRPDVIKIDPNDPPIVIQKQKENIGRGLVNLLENEYKKVKYFLHEHDGKKDVVISGSNKSGYNYRPECQFNVDSICDDYVKGTPVFRYFLGEEVHLISDEANLITCKMSYSTAEALDLFMNEYIKLNNGSRCEPFEKTMKVNFTAWGE